MIRASPPHSVTMSAAALAEFEHAFYIGNYMSGILYG